MFSSPALQCPALLWTTFPTELGWFGLIGHGDTVCRILIGHADAESVNNVITDEIEQQLKLLSEQEPQLEDWNPALRERLQQYAAGEPVCFADCKIELPQLTPFQSRVVSQTRKIAYGQTVSYGQLAKRCGSPGAARAVGSVMSSNRLPIVIPCHRVVGAKGQLGGFSAPRGTQLKQQMLQMESIQE